jgi:hypothetical protein
MSSFRQAASPRIYRCLDRHRRKVSEFRALPQINANGGSDASADTQFATALRPLIPAALTSFLEQSRLLQPIDRKLDGDSRQQKPH